MEIEDLGLEERHVGVELRSIVMLVDDVRGMRVAGLEGALMSVESPRLAGVRCVRQK